MTNKSWLFLSPLVLLVLLGAEIIFAIGWMIRIEIKDHKYQQWLKRERGE